MKILLVIPLLAAVLALASCASRASANASKTPATPKPVAAAVPPPAPPPPISSPQTDIELPPAQPISPEALATIQAAPKPTPPEPEAPAAKPPARRAASATPPRPESAAPVTADTPPVPPPLPPVPAPAEEQTQLQPVYSEEARRRILGEIEKRRAQIEGLLGAINQSRMTADQKSVINSIHSFMSVADDAAKRGDLRSAEALSERALILAKELSGGR